MSKEWALRPGDSIVRKELHAAYGGRSQGGIGPSAKTPNVFVFTDPAAGEQHGYFDRWRPDGCFHYTGEGQRGDQLMVSGNAAVLNHASAGRALRVFSGARGRVTYVGQFALDSERPYYEREAPETGGGPIRKVIVFRMRPLDSPPQQGTSLLDEVLAGGAVVEVPVEEQWTERAFVDPSGDTYEADRREQRLVLAFKAHLEDRGHEVCRWRIAPPGEANPLFADLFDKTTRTLIEAKGSVERGAIRMAIGQLMDYGRFVDAANRAVLLPERPREDVLTLLASAGLTVIWRTHDGFADTVGGALV